MKNTLQLFLLLITISIQAQDFKPYKVKSGKIVYEKLRYSTHSVFKSENGVETSFSEQVPYVAEQAIYYWDEFGDVAFEEIYQVSAFGGKPLSEKIKIAERLWTGDHRYYFNIEENKVSDDPYYSRIKCRENFQYYQIIGSWIKTQYMGVEEAGTSEILGKEATYYKIDTSTDLFAWKDLVLKQEDFATTRNGERLYPDRTKIAVEIDTISKVNDTVFNPIWSKREKLYNALDENKIVELIDVRPDVLEQADNVEGIQLQKNDILLFVTSKLTVGKMQVLAIDKNNQLIVKYSLYSYNDILDWGDSFKIKSHAIVNIDSPFIKDITPKELDFKYENSQLFPQNNISILLLKPSRTTNLTIKPYSRD